MFHDDILPKEVNNSHWYWAEKIIFWVLIILLAFNVFKILFALFTDCITNFRKWWNWKDININRTHSE